MLGTRTFRPHSARGANFVLFYLKTERSPLAVRMGRPRSRQQVHQFLPSLKFQVVVRVYTIAFTSSAHSSNVRVSARRRGGMHASHKTMLAPPRFFNNSWIREGASRRLLRIVLRRWAKPALTTCHNSASSFTSALIFGRTRRFTTVLHTLGTGRNACGATSNNCSASQ